MDSAYSSAAATSASGDDGVGSAKDQYTLRRRDLGGVAMAFVAAPNVGAQRAAKPSAAAKGWSAPQKRSLLAFPVVPGGPKQAREMYGNGDSAHCVRNV